MNLNKKKAKIFILSGLLLAGICGSMLQAQGYSFYSLGVNGSAQDIMADYKGNVHFLWVNGYTINYARVVNNALTGKVAIGDLAGGETVFTRPRIAVRNDGVTIHTCSGWLNIKHFWRDESGVWRSEIVRPASGTIKYCTPICAVTPDETVHLFFGIGSTTSEVAKLNYIRKPKGGTWSANMQLTTTNLEHRCPAVFVDKNGGLHLSWCANGTSTGSYYRYAPFGTNIENVATEMYPGAAGVTVRGYGDLYVTPDGAVHHPFETWVGSQASGYNAIDYTYKPIGGSWSTPTRPSIGGLAVGDADDWPAVAVDNRGQRYVAFKDKVGGVEGIILSAWSGGTWTKYTVDANSGTSLNGHLKPSLTATAGAIYGVWRKLPAGNSQIGPLTLVVASQSPLDLVVTQPASCTTLNAGDSKTITWTSSGVAGDINIYLYRNFLQVGVIAQNIPVADGAYVWTVSQHMTGNAPAGQGYEIRIRTTDNAKSSYSFGSFAISGTIQGPSITITSPRGGENLTIASALNIIWTTYQVNENLNIYLLKDGYNVGTIALDVDEVTGSYSWNVGNHSGGAAAPGTGYKIYITNVSETVRKISNAFTIAAQNPPSLTLTSPKGGENWITASTQKITWTAANINENLNIYLLKDGCNVGTIALNVDEVTGSYSWNVGNHSGGAAAPGTGYKIYITNVSETVRKISNAFTIAAQNPPSLTFTSPKGGENWIPASTQKITWTAANINENLNIYLIKDGRNVGTIALNVDEVAGSYSWAVGKCLEVTAPVGTGYRIYLLTVSGAVGKLSSTFSITTAGNPTLKVAAPANGVSWKLSSTQRISWSYASLSGNVNIYLYNGSTCKGTIASNLPIANIAYSWSVGTLAGGIKAPAGSGYSICIKTTNGSKSAWNGGTFTIAK